MHSSTHQKMFRIKLVGLIAFVCLSNSQKSFAQEKQFGKDSNAEVVKAMTLEEKARFVAGTCQIDPVPPPAAPGTSKNAIEKVDNTSPNTYSTINKVSGAAGDSYGIPRLGVPSIVFADGPAGLRINPRRGADRTRTYYASAFPISTLLASSWDVNLVKNVGKAMGNEVLEYGVDVLLAPGINIHRNPLTGRNFEYYSEDPLLTGKIASAMINGVQSNGVGTSIKHYAVNNQETYRNGIDAIVSERALREIYLKGFEIAIKESHPWTVMSSYNKVNGEYASESQKLLTNILRNEFGFNGFVMTDWWAAGSPVVQMKAGNDMLMPGYESQIQAIITAVKNKELDEKVLDRNILNILNIIQKTPSFKKYNYSDAPDLKAHSKIIREAASEGMILLENKNKTLPFDTTIKKVALLGVGSYRINIGGHGSGYVYSPYKINIEKGLVDANLSIDNRIATEYNEYIKNQLNTLPEESFWFVPSVPEKEIASETLNRLANETDIAILTINRDSGEGEDRKLEKGDYYLTDLELGLIKNTVEAFKNKGKKVIVILNTGGVIEMTDWKAIPDAILLAWQPGEEAGHSIADVLTGKVNPSGKLATTFPKKYSDVPSANNFPWSNDSHNSVEYKEDIYVGYRHYSTHKIAPLYEFGYGLSYSNFDYSNLSVALNKKTNEIKVSVTVKNTGKVAGKEVVQVYVNAPKGEIEKPSIELKSFGKTKLLQSGESQKLSFTIKQKELASYNEKQSAWITDAGDYVFYIGSSSIKLKASKKIKL